MSIGLVHDPIFQKHNPGKFHCESPFRLEAITKALTAWPNFGQTSIIPLRIPKKNEILRVHSTTHLTRIAATAKKKIFLDQDTHTSSDSYEVALLAAGSLLNLCDAALKNEINAGIALTRPPGHHASTNQAMGFCLFNNVAIAAKHLLEHHGLKRIIIIDWDVHHGNGTENIFFCNKNVFYFSIHQFPFYPGTGLLNTVGGNNAKGYTLNIPLTSGQDDLSYIQIFEKLLVPIVRQFKPEFILISAGFDSHRDDPLGGMQITEAGFAGMSLIIKELADEFCPNNMIMTLEGGYNPTAQAKSIIAILDTLENNSDKAKQIRLASRESNPPEIIKLGQKIMNNYWKIS